MSSIKEDTPITWDIQFRDLPTVLRTKLGISQREFDALLLNGQIQSDTGQDLKKCKLSSSEIIIKIS